MTSKRVSLFAGTILGGALLLGTAGLALAQDPTATPSPSVTRGTFGGMMGSQGVQGMMGGMDAGDIAAMHRALGQNGTCDPKLMQSIHGKSSGAGS
jgi:Spy/CpxP family protein refolding chaperone